MDWVILNGDVLIDWYKDELADRLMVDWWVDSWENCLTNRLIVHL